MSIKNYFFYFILDAYTTDHIQYIWKTDNVKIISDEMSQYSVMKSETFKRSNVFADIGIYRGFSFFFLLESDFACLENFYSIF